MFKVSRLTDYGVVILRYLWERRDDHGALSSARDISSVSGLPRPTVSKILKLMARHKLVAAKRGSLGGYELVEMPTRISIMRLIEIFEGTPALTSCLERDNDSCQIHLSCPQRGQWHVVHKKLAHVLENISLSELITGSEGTRRLSSEIMRNV